MIEEKEILLSSFQAIRTSFASLVSVSSIVTLVSGFLTKEPTVNLDDPKDEAIKFCIEGNLGDKLCDMTRKLQNKKDYLKRANLWQTKWIIIYSIIIFLLVMIDFFGFSLADKYNGIGIDCLISLTGIYFMSCACALYSVFTYPREKLGKHRLTRFLFVIHFNDLNYDSHWIKECHLSFDEQHEIRYLLEGLNPNITDHLKVEKFCKELEFGLVRSPTELTHLVASKIQSYSSNSTKQFLELINQTEFKANQEALNNYFNLGETLAKFLLKDQNYPQGEFAEEIIQKFSPINSHTEEIEEIRKNYLDPEDFWKGLTLAKFFEMHPQKKRPLSDDEINIAHNALKIYFIFNNIIGKEKINQIRTFSASTIGNFTREEVHKIIIKKGVMNHISVNMQ